MKRFQLTFMALTLAAGMLSGCDANANKTALIYGKYLGEMVALTYEEFVAKIDYDDNFVIFQTPNSACTCWTSFRDSILQPYIEANNIRVFTIPFAQFYNPDNTKRETFGIALNSSSQTLAIYKNGDLKLMREYNSTHKIWSSSDSFVTYLNELIINPKVIDLSYSDLQMMYTQSAPFSVIFYDEAIPSDYLLHNFLKQYVVENLDSMHSFFSFDANVSGVKRDINGDIDADQWQDFKDAYGLSSLHNSTYGWDNGFVPTIQYIEPDGTSTNGEVIKAQATYLNDVLTETEAPNTYQIASSYYSSARVNSLSYLASFTGTKVLENLLITSSDTEVQGSLTVWKNEAAAVYHDPLLKSFLDNNLPSQVIALIS